MAQTIRVSLPGYNALTNTSIYNYSLYADSDNILIKEFARGSGTLDFGFSATITHNLNYIPFYLVYCLVNTNRYRIANAASPLGGGWITYATTTTLVIKNSYHADYKNYKYYIFYDNIT
jgi:hypothetical protein